jgi:hypothetical protein
MPARDKVILRLVLSLALHIEYQLFQLHVGTAYLNGSLKETIFMI